MEKTFLVAPDAYHGDMGLDEVSIASAAEALAVLEEAHAKSWRFWTTTAICVAVSFSFFTVYLLDANSVSSPTKGQSLNELKQIVWDNKRVINKVSYPHVLF